MTPAPGRQRRRRRTRHRSRHLKDDLGIPAGDTSQDAWLQRRVDGVWARMEAYTWRKLCSPPLGFIDDWGELIDQGYAVNQPPRHRLSAARLGLLAPLPGAANHRGRRQRPGGRHRERRVGPRLRQAPVARRHRLRRDLGRVLLDGRARITYMAGWAELPADLYECLLGCMQVLWNGRQSQSAGMGGGTVNRISVIDVGDVELSQVSPFVEGTLKGAGAISDPLLGPYAHAARSLRRPSLVDGARDLPDHDRGRPPAP